MFNSKNNKSNKTSIYKKMTSGVDFYYIPMEDYNEKMVAVSFGSGGNSVHYKNGKKNIDFPYGTAHFLEHRMFRQKFGDAFSKFVELGADANAFTDCNKTVYYFNTEENFGENLRLLLNMVENPYFLEDEIQKEKSIIESEISLYNDEPSWIVYYNMLELMYRNHPIKVPIAGTEKSISHINKELLEQAFQLMYTSRNMTIVCTGDISLDFLINEVKGIRKKETDFNNIINYETMNIVNDYTEVNIGLCNPVYQIGVKLPVLDKKDFSYKLAISIALDMWVGDSSNFTEKALNNGYIEEPLGWSFLNGKGFSFIAFSGDGKYYEEIRRLLIVELNKIINIGISNKNFERIKRKQIGRFLKTTQNVTNITLAQIEWADYGITVDEVFSYIKKIKKKDISNIFSNYLGIATDFVISVGK